MYRIIAILFIVAPALTFIFEQPAPPGLTYKYDRRIVAVDKYIEAALSNQSAYNRGYDKMNRPRFLNGFCPLQLWCRKDENFRVCILTDETGDVGGVQINIPEIDFNPTFDMRQQGFTIWTTSIDNVILRFYAFYILFTSPDYRIRVNSKNITILLRDNTVYYSGFNAEMFSVSVDESEISSDFTKQGCVGKPSQRYFYQMTKNTQCTASTLSPLSVMYYNGQLVGVRVMVFGHFARNSPHPALFEDINALTAKMSLPNGPDCFFENISQRGAIAMTVYFTSLPWLVSCLLE